MTSVQPNSIRFFSSNPSISNETKDDPIFSKTLCRKSFIFCHQRISKNALEKSNSVITITVIYSIHGYNEQIILIFQSQMITSLHKCLRLQWSHGYNKHISIVL